MYVIPEHKYIIAGWWRKQQESQVQKQNDAGKMIAFLKDKSIRPFTSDSREADSSPSARGSGHPLFSRFTPLNRVVGHTPGYP